MKTDNGPISVHARGGEPFPGTPALEWRIQGSKGELRVTSKYSSLNVGGDGTKVELWTMDGGGEDENRNGEGKVEVLEPERDEWGMDEKKGFGREVGNIARLYEAYRKGEWVPDFGWAVERHDLIEEMWRRYDEERG